MGETIAPGILGAMAGIVLGMGGAYAVAKSAPSLSAIVQTSNNTGKGGLGDSLGAGGGLFRATIGGPVQTVANPSATHTVQVPFSAPVSVGMIVLAVVLAVTGALLAGSLGGWQISRLQPAVALASVE